MANNLIQIKRTSVSGRAANTTTLSNPGELALNMTDGILYSGNGSVVFEIGANTTNSRVTGNLTVKGIIANGSIGTAGYVLSSNGSSTYWSSAVGYSGSIGYTGSQGANSLYTVSNSAPLSPTSGDRWFNTDIGAEFVYTYDGDSSQWVEIAASGFIGQTGYTGSAGPSTFPLNNQTSSYVATANDNGGLIYTTSNVVINSSVFSNGQNFTVFNNASSNVTIVANGVTLFFAGTSSTGNRTLYQKGLASIICVSTNTFAISGTIA